jgi:hypothetical protein
MQWSRGSALLLAVVLPGLPGAFSVPAQPAFTWAASAGGTDSDAANGVAVDRAGDIYVAGDFESGVIDFSGATLTNSGTAGSTANAFLAKYSATGHFIWARPLAVGPHDAIARRVAVDASGHVYVLGEFRSAAARFGEIILTNSGPDSAERTTDVFLAKLDGQGNTLWAVQSAGGYDESGRGLAIGPQGEAFIAGYFDSPVATFGSQSLTNSGDSDYEDIFVAKYDLDGRLAWARQAGGRYHDAAFAVAADQAGNCFVAGGFASPDLRIGEVSLAAGAGKNAFVAKYDSAGNVLWAAQSGGDGFDTGLAIAADPGGNAYAAGYFTSGLAAFGGVTLTNSAPSGRDIFLVKYSPAGHVLWARQAGGPMADEAWDAAADASGGVYLTGCFNSPVAAFGTTSITNESAPGDSSVFVAHYGRDGGVLWATAANGGGPAAVTGICVDVDGDICLAGWYSRPISFSGNTLAARGWEDIFLAAMQADAGQLEVTRDGDRFTVTWPVNGGADALEESTDAQSANWSPANGAPSLSGNRYVLTGAISNAPLFFRLHKP